MDKQELQEAFILIRNSRIEVRIVPSLMLQDTKVRSSNFALRFVLANTDCHDLNLTIAYTEKNLNTFRQNTTKHSCKILSFRLYVANTTRLNIMRFNNKR